MNVLFLVVVEYCSLGNCGEIGRVIVAVVLFVLPSLSFEFSFLSWRAMMVWLDVVFDCHSIGC